jgi:hypothetical protein
VSAALPEYPWFDQVPEHLKTRNQLAEQGLRPGGPVVARVVWRRGKRWADLYDVGVAKPKQQPTEAQLAALAKAQEALRTCPGCKTVYNFVLGPRWKYWEDCGVCHAEGQKEERREVAQQACAWLADPQTLILDTETTDLDGYLVQIAVITVAGEVLLDTLVNPQAPISPGAQAVHGITEEQVREAPTFSALGWEITRLLHKKQVIVYNADFDQGVLWREVERWVRNEGAPAPEGESREAFAMRGASAWCKRVRWHCAMELYAAYVGDWSDYHGNYRWQPLPGGDHTALGDCRATLAVLQRMAAWQPQEGTTDGLSPTHAEELG